MSLTEPFFFHMHTKLGKLASFLHACFSFFFFFTTLDLSLIQLQLETLTAAWLLLTTARQRLLRHFLY